jgi:hypothetical protein
MLLALIAAVQPFPPSAEAMMYCIPLLGPRMRFSPRLPERLRPRTFAHESVHAEQCRARGPLRLYWEQLHPAIRARNEAEAGCAEAAVKIREGSRSDHAFEDLVDDLTYAVPQGQSPGPNGARALAREICPALAQAADSVSLHLHRGPPP